MAMAAPIQALVERVAVVSASTKGIGLAIARQLGLDGAKVVVSSRKADNVQAAVDSLRLDGIDCDGCVAHVGVDEDRKKLIDFAIQRYSKLDILVSNAAVNPHHGDLMEVSDKQWDRLLNINVKSAYLLTKEALPHLEQSPDAAIVLVNSLAGYAPIDGIGAYSIMKSALTGITKGLSLSLARKNIRVNAIAPGIIRTDFSKVLTDSENSGLDANRLVPIGRFGEAAECAGAVSFLVSSNAAYLTGETLGINGGIHARI